MPTGRPADPAQYSSCKQRREPLRPRRQRKQQLLSWLALRLLSWVPLTSVSTLPDRPYALPRGAVRRYDCLRPFQSVSSWLPRGRPWVDAPCVSRPARTGFGSFDGCVDRQTPGCLLRRSPSFRRLLPKRREALPSSPITLLPTCPALRPRWCPARSPWRAQDCCLPVRIPSAFGSVVRTYPTVHEFSELNDAACVLALPLLRTVLLSTRPSVRLPTGWLACGRVGLEHASHPLGNVDEFQGESPLFLVPGLARHENAPG
jgi:hypothetical protein